MTSVSGNVVGIKGGCKDTDEALDAKKLGGNNGGVAESSAIEGLP